MWRVMRRRSSGGEGVEANGVSGRDWLLVKGPATFFWQGALTSFRPEPGFFLWGLLFVRWSKTLDYPKGKGF